MTKVGSSKWGSMTKNYSAVARCCDTDGELGNLDVESNSMRQERTSRKKGGMREELSPIRIGRDKLQ